MKEIELTVLKKIPKERERIEETERVYNAIRIQFLGKKQKKKRTKMEVVHLHCQFFYTAVNFVYWPTETRVE